MRRRPRRLPRARGPTRHQQRARAARTWLPGPQLPPRTPERAGRAPAMRRPAAPPDPRRGIQRLRRLRRLQGRSSGSPANAQRGAPGPLLPAHEQRRRPSPHRPLAADRNSHEVERTRSRISISMMNGGDRSGARRRGPCCAAHTEIGPDGRPEVATAPSPAAEQYRTFEPELYRYVTLGPDSGLLAKPRGSGPN